MEHIKTFLDISTIHGLSWISSTKKWSRLLWILIVIGGFSGAGYLIYESFDSWKQSPISTTIETLPISKITFPNVTVCPPRDLFLNLNYDIKESENIEFDKDKRKTLIESSLGVLQDLYFNELIRNLGKLKDPDRYYNWYHGYTKVEYPSTYSGQISYNMHTTATSGNISTQYLMDTYNAKKVESNIMIVIFINVPPIVMVDNNYTLMLDIDKRTVKDNDKMKFNYFDDIDADLTHWSKNITAPTKDYYSIQFERKISQYEISKMKLKMMPGFGLSWNYNRELEPEARYIKDDTNKEFARWVKLQYYDRY